jgi:hypothetical protein
LQGERGLSDPAGCFGMVTGRVPNVHAVIK